MIDERTREGGEMGQLRGRKKSWQLSELVTKDEGLLARSLFSSLRMRIVHLG